MARKKETKISKYMKAPIKILAKAKDFYIRSVTQCSYHVEGHATAFGFPAVCHVSTLPRSFSASSAQSTTSSADVDMTGLVRAASTRNMIITQNKPGEVVNVTRGAPQPDYSRNSSVKIERIDEDKAYESSGDKNLDNKFWRSKSYSVSKSTYALR